MVTITISGTPGSGKSTIACMLKEQLNIPYVYSGMIFRSLADKHHMTLADFGVYCEHHKEVDREIDTKQVKILKKGNVILEGRLAGWLAHLNNISAFKVMIDADVTIRAQRIVTREQGTVDQRKQDLLTREKSERKRYKKYYNIDLRDTSIYDLVIDSTSKNPEEVVKLIISRL